MTLIGQLYFDTLLRYVLSVTFRGAVVMKVLAQKTRGHKYHNALYLSPQNFDKRCLQFLLGVKMAPRETENNA